MGTGERRQAWSAAQPVRQRLAVETPWQARAVVDVEKMVHWAACTPFGRLWQYRVRGGSAGIGAAARAIGEISR